MTRPSCLSRLALTRTGQLATVAAGVALWAIAWPVLLPTVVVAVVVDAVESRRSER